MAGLTATGKSLKSPLRRRLWIIIAPDQITLIDFKTGHVGHLADKYRLQMVRYRTILQGLFPWCPIEGYLLFMDEPHRIVMV